MENQATNQTTNTIDQSSLLAQLLKEEEQLIYLLSCDDIATGTTISLH